MRTHRDNARISTDDLLLSRAAKLFEDTELNTELAARGQALLRSDVLGWLLVGVLITACLVLAFYPGALK